MSLTKPLAGCDGSFTMVEMLKAKKNELMNDERRIFDDGAPALASQNGPVRTAATTAPSAAK